MTCAERRRRGGELQRCEPSRFLQELPADDLQLGRPRRQAVGRGETGPRQGQPRQPEGDAGHLRQVVADAGRYSLRLGHEINGGRAEPDIFGWRAFRYALLRLADHVGHRGPDVRIGEIHATTLRWHRTLAVAAHSYSAPSMPCAIRGAQSALSPSLGAPAAPVRDRRNRPRRRPPCPWPGPQPVRLLRPAPERQRGAATAGITAATMDLAASTASPAISLLPSSRPGRGAAAAAAIHTALGQHVLDRRTDLGVTDHGATLRRHAALALDRTGGQTVDTTLGRQAL